MRRDRMKNHLRYNQDFKVFQTQYSIEVEVLRDSQTQYSVKDEVLRDSKTQYSVEDEVLRDPQIQQSKH